MYETATLHFDLSNLAGDQEFTMHAGFGRYTLTRHTHHTLTLARRSNKALALLPDERITHFVGAVRLPANALALLRVTAPKLRSDDLLDRLVLTSIHLPRRHRMAGLARYQRLFPNHPLPTKLTAYGLTGIPPAEKDIIIDAGDWQTAQDCAQSLVFHHPEVLTLIPTPAGLILPIVETAKGLQSLAYSIYKEAENHDKNPSNNPNWVNSESGMNWKTGQPSNSIYVWSRNTLNKLPTPVKDVVQKTKNILELENQCWTVQPGIVQVPLKSVSQRKTALRTGLQDAEANYTVKELTPQSGVEHQFSYDPSSTPPATISFKNYYLRWLKISVDQYGPPPNNEPVGSTQSLGYLSPPDSIMAVPLPPGWSDFPFTFDEGASSAIVTMGGLGQTPFDISYDLGGIGWTALFNLAVPSIFIALGVSVDQLGSKWTDMQKTVVGKLSTFFEGGMEGPLGDAVTQSISVVDVLSAIANIACSLVLDMMTGSEDFQVFITEAIVGSSIEDAEPVIGWIARAIGSAADVASIIETSVEVASSPATMSVQILRTMDVQVTINPDSTPPGEWPLLATHYGITITYDDGPTYTYEGQMPPLHSTDPIVHTFSDLPAGGSLTVLFCCYAETDWVAGKGRTEPILAQPTQDSTLVVPAFAIKNNLVPLTSTSTYNFSEKLGFDRNQGRIWLNVPNASPPTDTVSDLNLSNVGNNLGALGGFGINELVPAFAYLWEASGQNVPRYGIDGNYSGQLWTFQSLSDKNPPQSGLKFSGYGYVETACLAVPPVTMANPLADGFLLEPNLNPNVPSTDVYLRALSLQPNQPLVISHTTSFARFNGVQADLAIHPAGYAVALNQANCKLQIVRLAPAVPDADAPVATILAGQGTRPGLLYNPSAIACSLDRILVLQAPSEAHPGGCVVSFDFKGNPVYGFANNQWVMSLRQEGTPNVQLLDLSVESKGYIYVLKYLQPPSGNVLASDYRLDIYNPDGSFLTQTAGIAAARMQVDLWRSLYALNYEILQGTGRTEPTVALWLPPAPPPNSTHLRPGGK